MFTYDSDDIIGDYTVRVYIKADDTVKTYHIQIDMWKGEPLRMINADYEDDLYLTYDECLDPETAIGYAWDCAIDWVDQLQCAVNEE